MQHLLLNKSKRNGLVILFSCLILYLNWQYLKQKDEFLIQEKKIGLTRPGADSLNKTFPQPAVNQSKTPTKRVYKESMRLNTSENKETVQPALVNRSDANSGEYRFSGKTKFTSRTSRRIQEIDINSADQAAWESLPGIGPYYAKLILNYRHKLGGFAQKDQIKETWNLPDSVYQKAEPFLTISSAIPRQINVNTCQQSDLAAHPYISEQEALAIINYRFQHGRFEQIEDLHNIRLVDKSTLDKILPYLTVESQPAPQL